MEEKQNSNKLQRLKSFLEEDSADPFLLFALAREYEILGQNNEALDTYKKLVEGSPEYVASYYHYGSLLHRMGQETVAMEIFQLGMHYAKKAGDHHALSELQRIAMEDRDLY